MRIKFDFSDDLTTKKKDGAPQVPDGYKSPRQRFSEYLKDGDSKRILQGTRTTMQNLSPSARAKSAVSKLPGFSVEKDWIDKFAIKWRRFWHREGIFCGILASIFFGIMMILCIPFFLLFLLTAPFGKKAQEGSLSLMEGFMKFFGEGIVGMALGGALYCLLLGCLFWAVVSMFCALLGLEGAFVKLITG